MYCLNCGSEVLSGNICTNCGVDMVLFEKTTNISDILYNKGLNLAKVRDLTGATDAFLKSVQFNKNNYYSRNLLGLIYYEIGRIGDALKEWVISASLVSEANPAIKYMDIVQNNTQDLERKNDAITMYNNALIYLEQESDDLAVIQLKKAVEISPNFIDALNLLTFCLLIQDNKKEAAGLVKRVLEIDMNNPIALNYFSEIYPNRERPKATAIKPDRGTRPNSEIPQTTMLTDQGRKKLFGNNFFFAEILSFIIGGVVVFALLYFLVIPGTKRENEAVINQLEDQIASMEVSQKSREEELNQSIKDLESKNTVLNKEYEELSKKALLEEEKVKVEAARSSYISGDNKEAASLIYGTDQNILDVATKETYDEIKAESYEKASEEYYSEALDLFTTEEFTEARRAFETCLVYAPSEVNYVDDATYFLGRIAEEEEDKEKAILYYENLVENFPDSNRFWDAQNRLDGLKEE